MGIPKNRKPDKISKRDAQKIDQMLEHLDNKKVNVRKKIKQALSETEKIQQIEAIKNVLSEYMDSYIIIGYDLTEDSMGFVKANSPMQYKAVMSLLEDVADDLLSPQMPPGMEF